MNFEDTDFRTELLDLENPYDVKLVSKFLKTYGFDFQPDDVELTMILYNLNNEIIGTGSYKSQTLKFVVVAPKFRESTAFSIIATYLTSIILEHHKRCFVFTKPENAPLFVGIGFSEIARAEPLFVALEFGYQLIDAYQKYLQGVKVETVSDNIAAMVVNCNPFTKGHLYLIEKAASENEIVYLFIVEENKSSFPCDIRKKLITQGVAHLKNVIVVSSGPYLVSGAVFPNYFLKQEKWDLITEKQAELDVKIFAQYVVPVLNIKKRYVGTENYCKVTKAYNEAMKRLLPAVGCRVIEITRAAIGFDDNNEPNFISASKVRNAIKEDRLSDILDFLPESTKNFLLSPEADETIQKIKQTQTRH
ncbi:MAG: hypothetical protein AUK44_06365 [Porphyromonadaceae bacterium CG2_30_38_12]|nr:MAG: hypothetical protein AUK44_06365 [Porphyromonadaceae bacterium CG2_30_38_12]